MPKGTPSSFNPQRHQQRQPAREFFEYALHEHPAQTEFAAAPVLVTHTHSARHLCAMMVMMALAEAAYKRVYTHSHTNTHPNQIE